MVLVLVLALVVVLLVLERKTDAEVAWGVRWFYLSIDSYCISIHRPAGCQSVQLNATQCPQPERDGDTTATRRRRDGDVTRQNAEPRPCGRTSQAQKMKTTLANPEMKTSDVAATETGKMIQNSSSASALRMRQKIVRFSSYFSCGHTEGEPSTCTHMRLAQ